MSEDPTGSGLGGASSVPATGGATGTGVAGGAGGVVGRVPNGGASALGRLVRGLPLPAHDHETPSTGGEIDYLRTAWGTAHVAPGANAHPEYATDADLTAALAGYPTPAAADALFLTPAEGDALFLTPAEGDAAYAAVDHTHPQVTTGEYHFQTNPAMTDPGQGNFRSNTGAAATATALAMDQIGAGGTDITTLFRAMRLNDTVFVQDKDVAANWVRYQLTAAPTINTGWAQVPVAVVGTGGTIAGTQLCVMQLTLTAGGGGGGGGAGVVASDPVWDAKGDLVAGTGADAAARLAVGTNGQVLTAASAQATGLAWATPTTLAHDHTTADGSGVLSNDEHDGFSQYVNLGADPSTPAANRIRLYSKDNGSGVSTLYYRSEDGAVYELPTLPTGGGGGSGAPSNATYVTLAAEAKLSAETALGTGVVMTGTLGARPAAATAGRLYLATDTDLVYRDSGSGWTTYATRHAQAHTLLSTDHPDVDAADTPADGDVLTYVSAAGKWQAVPAPGAGGGLPTTGGTMTGALVLQGASSTTNVLQAKLAADTQPRFRADASGLLEWGVGGTTAPAVSLVRTSTGMELNTHWLPASASNLDLGKTSASWRRVYCQDVTPLGALIVGSGSQAAAGAIRLRAGTNGLVAWRNGGNTGDNTLSIDSSDRLALAVGAATLTTSATAGAASALPGVPAGYLTVVVNGTAVKLAYWT